MHNHFQLVQVAPSVWDIKPYNLKIKVLGQLEKNKKEDEQFWILTVSGRPP